MQVKRPYRKPSAAVNGGYYLVHRRMLEHELVGAGSLGKFSRFEAWHWLLANAAFEEKLIRNNGHVISLNPGELVASVSYLAQSWNWTDAAVRWFLEKLKQRHAISVHSKPRSRQAQLISINKYREYQTNAVGKQHITRVDNSSEHSDRYKDKQLINKTTLGENGFWQEQLNPGEKPAEKPAQSASEPAKKVSAVHSAAWQNGALVVSDGLRDHWLPAFGGDHVRLGFALQQVAGYVQPNSNRPLVAQIHSQLARIVGNKRDGDARYAAGKAKQLGAIATTIRDTSESFDDYRARMLREGKISDERGTNGEKPQ